MDDCLRCHGMHFNGAVRDLVQPQNAQGDQDQRRQQENEPEDMDDLQARDQHVIRLGDRVRQGTRLDRRQYIAEGHGIS